MLNTFLFSVWVFQILLRANNADPDQTVPQEQSDQGLHCLLRFQSVPILNVITVFYQLDLVFLHVI